MAGTVAPRGPVVGVTAAPFSMLYLVLHHSAIKGVVTNPVHGLYHRELSERLKEVKGAELNLVNHCQI